MPILRSESLTAEERLLALVSRLHFLENKVQVEIKDDPEVRALYRSTLPIGRQTDDQTLSQATVNRLLRRARDLGVVSITVDASFAVKAQRELELSRRVQDRFRLKQCFALRPRDSMEPEDSTAVDPGDADEDRLILSIVSFTAEEISGVLNPGDHVMCAGGRTICWLARAVRRVAPPKRGLIFTPLSGRLWVEDFKTGDADIMERPLDADDAVHIFAEAFEDEPGGQFSQINQPLYCTGKQEEAAEKARNILSRHCAIGAGDSCNWGLPNANRALVGIGSLESSSHRITIFLRKFQADIRTAKESYLRAAGPNLIKIHQLCEDSGLPLPGDMANRLYPSLPLPSELKRAIAGDGNYLPRMEHALPRIAKEIRDLNAKAVVIPWAHLRRIPLTRVICTGRSKLRALYTVMLAGYLDVENGATPLVKELSTDQVTASQLLSELTIIQADPELMKTYAKWLAEFGLLEATSGILSSPSSTLK